MSDTLREGQTRELKSLRLVIGPSADLADLARACVAFANADGGWQPEEPT